MRDKLLAHNKKLNKLLKKARNRTEKSLIKSKIQCNNDILNRENKNENKT